jgi:hypothetical protein
MKSVAATLIAARLECSGIRDRNWRNGTVAVTGPKRTKKLYAFLI